MVSCFGFCGVRRHKLAATAPSTTSVVTTVLDAEEPPSGNSLALPLSLSSRLEGKSGRSGTQVKATKVVVPYDWVPFFARFGDTTPQDAITSTILDFGQLINDLHG